LGLSESKIESKPYKMRRGKPKEGRTHVVSHFREWGEFFAFFVKHERMGGMTTK